MGWEIDVDVLGQGTWQRLPRVLRDKVEVANVVSRLLELHPDAHLRVRPIKEKKNG